MANTPSFGVSAFWINGQSYGVRGTAKYRASGDTRTAMMNAQGGIAGYTAVPKAAEIEVELTDRGDLSLSDINTLTGATVILETKDGKAYTITNAFRVGDPLESDIMEGKFAFKISGVDIEVKA